MNAFTDRIALVTGGSSGIGRAVALGFARTGAHVVIGDVNEAGSMQTAALIENEGRRALFVRVDTTKAADVEHLVAQTIKTFGRLDFAFNNAGILHAPAKISDLDEAVFDRVVNVDLKGTFLCMKYELREMVKAGRGVIVNTASVAGLLPEGNMSAYVAAKHGVVGLTKTAAIEVAGTGVRVNALAPGWVRTAMTKAWEEDAAFLGKLKAAAPMHRGAEPEEMVSAVLHLCADESSYTNGHTLVVDGAQTIRGLLPYEG